MQKAHISFQRAKDVVLRDCQNFSLAYWTILLLASERSELDTYRGNTIENRGCLFVYWPASETLTGVTQLKIGDVCLFIYLYICLDVCM